MIKKYLYIPTCFAIFFLLKTESFAQVIRDSTGTKLVVVANSVGSKQDSVILYDLPRKAAIRSAIIPGWGQVYVRRDMNGSFFKKYWKVPVIYGALGTSAGVFVYNVKNYRMLRFAYQATYKASLPNFDSLNPRPGPFRDSTDYFKINPRLIGLDQASLKYNRDEFRRNVDYSVLFFILLWGLNVVDATVDAHLKSFDVSPDISLRIKPGYSEMARTNGISVVLTFK